MIRIPCGIETEYGLDVEGRGAEDQIDDSMTLVRSYAGERFFGWDYRAESPRQDLRGFVTQLSFDPKDAVFDAGKSRGPDQEVRSDQILPNGARFYNDHGHPEYATPECFSVREAARHDKAGEIVVARAADEFSRSTGRRARIFKNNTDFHGASYGTHESYLVPRELGFDRLSRAVIPVLVARTLLCGAGKVGAESGGKIDFQMSQRADFFTEAASIDTLFRRPIFNTRDEPHADRNQWIRLHVISGDANMMVGATARKLALVKLCLLLELEGGLPEWKLKSPVAAIVAVSRGIEGDPKIDLEGGSWTTARHIIEGLLDAAEERLELDEELQDITSECRGLLEDRAEDPEAFSRKVDWAAKRSILDMFREEEGIAWTDPHMQALDLAYTSLDPEEGLFPMMADEAMVDPQPTESELVKLLTVEGAPDTRARARGAAVHRLRDRLHTASWGSVVFRDGDELVEAQLPPDRAYSEAFLSVESVEDFLRCVQES
jgi:proteasome accessory factor A